MSEKILFKEAVIPSPVADVWRAWTTNEGVRTFFAPDSKIELKIGGRYEILFDEGVPGQRGSEDCVILSYLPEKMLSYNWSAPPHLPNVRKERTWVVILFEAISPGATQLKFYELGWGEGEEWEQCYAYFDRAWGIVLSRLQQRFETGPLDWRTIG